MRNIPVVIAGVWLIGIVLILVGWFMNVWALVHMPISNSAEFVLRVVGLFIAPLGGIMGYL